MRQPPGHMAEDFRPQPFEQMINVLRAMGHEEDAKDIAIFKQDRLRPGRTAGTFFAFRPLKWLMWWLYARLTGYGYRPARMFGLLLLLWVGCSLFYAEAARQGVFAPADPHLFLETDLCRLPPAGWQLDRLRQDRRRIYRFQSLALFGRHHAADHRSAAGNRLGADAAWLHHYHASTRPRHRARMGDLGFDVAGNHHRLGRQPAACRRADRHR